MPLTLECYCDDNVVVCQLAALYFEFYADYEEFGPNGASSAIELTHNPTGTSEDSLVFATDPSNGPHSVSIPLGIAGLVEWTSLKVHVTFASSLFQPPSSAPARLVLTFWIRLLYDCIDLATGMVVKQKSIHAAPGVDIGFSPDGSCTCFDVIERVRIVPNGIEWVDADGERNREGGVVGLLWTSSPLGSCYGCTVSFGPGFIPRPKDQIIDIDGSGGPICVCASDGTAPYHFFVRSGQLPPGLTLNGDTGCLEGDATGPATEDVEFGVIDADGSEASVTCVFGKGCEAEQVVGNVMY